jgi:hypothetical protein
MSSYDWEQGNINVKLRQAVVLEIVKRTVGWDTVEESAPTQTEEDATSSLRVRDERAPATLGSFTRSHLKRRNGGTSVGYTGQAALRREQCDIIIEKRAVTRLRHSKQLSVTTIAHVTEEQCFLWGPRV